MILQKECSEVCAEEPCHGWLWVADRPSNGTHQYWIPMHAKFRIPFQLRRNSATHNFAQPGPKKTQHNAHKQSDLPKKISQLFPHHFRVCMSIFKNSHIFSGKTKGKSPTYFRNRTDPTGLAHGFHSAPPDPPTIAKRLEPLQVCRQRGAGKSWVFAELPSMQYFFCPLAAHIAVHTLRMTTR
jgi:hypothetical protein